VSDFGWSWVAEELDGVDELEEDDGLEVEPLPAEPFVLPEELGVELEDDEAPPPAESFFWVSIELEDEELEGELDAPDGVLVEPEDDAAPDGELAGLVVVDEDPVAARSLARSQAVSRLAPSAMETAIAMVDSLMWPPWLGYFD